MSGITMIDRDPLEGMTAEDRTLCNRALDHALNENHRQAKRSEFASRNSEDRLTWSVFRYLQSQNAVRAALSATEEPIATVAAPSEPTLLFWGVPTPHSATGESIANQVLHISDSLGENSQSRSEPDVIADFGPAGLVIIEAKYKSPNDLKPPDYGGWSRYLGSGAAFATPQETKASEMYELARNWRIGVALAGDRPFTLMNLGTSRTFAPKHRAALTRFVASLDRSSNRSFLTTTWQDLLRDVPGAGEAFGGPYPTLLPKPIWPFSEYLKEAVRSGGAEMEKASLRIRDWFLRHAAGIREGIGEEATFNARATLGGHNTEIMRVWASGNGIIALSLFSRAEGDELLDRLAAAFRERLRAMETVHVPIAALADDQTWSRFADVLQWVLQVAKPAHSLRLLITEVSS